MLLMMRNALPPDIHIHSYLNAVLPLFPSVSIAHTAVTLVLIAATSRSDNQQRELRSIHEGITSIASNAVPKNIPKDNDQARMVPSTVFQSKQLSEKAVSSKNAENDASENPEHIDVVSVEIVNVLDGDDSVASADDFVPEIPSIAQVSLN